MSRLIPPAGQRRIYLIECRPPGRRAMRIAASRQLSASQRMQVRIDALALCRTNGEPPSPQLENWIANLPVQKVDRLVAMGLLERRRFEQSHVLWDDQSPRKQHSYSKMSAEELDALSHIDAYQRAVANRKQNTWPHAEAMARQVLRICKALNAIQFADLNEENVLNTVGEWSVALNTRRHYLVAISDFGRWMKRTGRALTNPFEGIPMPSAEAESVRNRRPLSVGEFRELMEYLDGLGDARYPHQQASWTAADRKMIYWTAVKTAYRQHELQSLKRWQLFLDDQPAAQIDILAKDAKNRTAASVPIPKDLAAALAGYTLDMHPMTTVFRFPGSRQAVVDMLRRDLDGARKRWIAKATAPHDRQVRERAGFLRDINDQGQVVDFHALRSTAITWWLDVDGLSQKKVQILARLKTLRLVENYTRGAKLEDYNWLDRSPSLFSPRRTDPEVQQRVG